MKLVVTTLILFVMVGFAVHPGRIARAPNIEAKPLVGNPPQADLGLKPLPPPPSPYSPDQHIIASIPDLRSTAGSPGKNIIFAEDGQNIAVIYGRFGGDPTNIFQVMVAYSTDRGNTWTNYGPLSTFDARRVYPGLDARQDWPETDYMIHFAWHQAAQEAGNYVASPTFYAKEVSYPDGLITAAYEMPNSLAWDVWSSAIAAKDSFVIYTAVNNGTYLTTYEGYIWRSTDYGETWDNGRVFFPGPLDWMWGPHFRFGSDGYIFFLFCRLVEGTADRYWPYFCESFNYGESWTNPQPIWQDIPPYQDMSDVKCWWYMYDCEMVNDTPVATVKLGTANYDYGEIWVYRPDSGSAGSWHFKGTKLVGGDSIAPQTYARFPTVAADENGNAYIGYQAFLIIPGDTVFDCGLFVRPANQDTWIDYGRCTFNGDDIEENHLEFAHNAPLIENDTKVLIGMIYHNAGDYPTTGNLYYQTYDTLNPIGIAESKSTSIKPLTLTVTPNPFQKTVKFTLPPNMGEAKLAIYDVTGKLVTSHKLPVTSHCFVWDGRNNNGTLVNSGVYFYSVSSKTGNIAGKVILTR